MLLLFRPLIRHIILQNIIVASHQLVAKIHPTTACFRARILRVATKFASFSILANIHY